MDTIEKAIAHTPTLLDLYQVSFLFFNYRKVEKLPARPRHTAILELLGRHDDQKKQKLHLFYTFDAPRVGC